MIIVYCETCGVRVQDDELRDGTAQKTASDGYVCGNCAQKSAPSPGEKIKSSSRHVEPARPSSGAAATHPPPRNVHATRRPEPARKDGNSYAIVGIAVAAVVLIICVVALGGKKEPERDSKTAAAPAEVKPPVLHPAPPPPIVSPAPVPPPSPPPSTEEPADKASKLLAAAKDIKATDPELYRDKLTLIAANYRGTGAAAEAASLLAALARETAPPPPVPAPPPAPPAPPTHAPTPLPAPASTPAPQSTEGWTPLFDGKSNTVLDSDVAAQWRVENGALINSNPDGGFAQSRKDFGDGAIRFRFEVSGNPSGLRFSVRQGENHAEQIVEFKRAEATAMAGKAHEMIFNCRADTVTATLDGIAAAIKPSPVVQSGRFRFSINDGTLRILAIEFQPPVK